MELPFVKKYLRIDTDEDDEVLQLAISAAEEYVVASVGENVDFTKARVKLLVLNLISAFYDNRVFTVEKVNEKVQFSINSIITQLQAEHYMIQVAQITG